MSQNPTYPHTRNARAVVLAPYPHGLAPFPSSYLCPRAPPSRSSHPLNNVGPIPLIAATTSVATVQHLQPPLFVSYLNCIQHVSFIRLHLQNDPLICPVFDNNPFPIATSSCACLTAARSSGCSGQSRQSCVLLRLSRMRQIWQPPAHIFACNCHTSSFQSISSNILCLCYNITSATTSSLSLALALSTYSVSLATTSSASSRTASSSPSIRLIIDRTNALTVSRTYCCLSSFCFSFNSRYPCSISSAYSIILYNLAACYSSFQNTLPTLWYEN